ncbi:MAG: Eco57I restriction-modification methylase domain-containing protein [Planctomycetes bacterium]|nr:Eco57I restriction-modification methylase domain-containing protein [Planctomycetota bacterium]MCW8134444.1 Eco57I restriction-modification methylase domain-containing protein [Planctomycetota bacterium]
MLPDDRDLTKDDVMSITGRDALVRFFAHLGYNTDARQLQTADALGIAQSGLKSAAKHIERVSADGDLQVFLFEVTSVTLAHRRAITSLLNNRKGDFLFVLTTPDYERLDFVLVERFRKDADEEAPIAGAQTVRARPLAISVERRKPSRQTLRTLRRLTYTCADDLGQLEKLLSAFRIAQWSEKRFNNVALFSDHYLTQRLPEEREWQDVDALKAAYKSFRQRGDTNKTDQAKAVDLVVHPVLKLLGHKPADAKAADDGPMLRLSENVVCFAYHWMRSLDTKDENDPSRPDDIPAVRVVTEFEKTSAQWAILTNGKQWRIYCARAHGRHANFYEVDFREMLADRPGEQGEQGDGESFRYFWLMLRAEAFKPGPEQDGKPGPSFLDRLFDGSREYAKALGERLKERVFETIFPHFAEGFIANMKAANPRHEFTDEELNDVFRATLTLLYRLIFLLYAESRDLLPVTEANYFEVSLRKLAKEIADKAGTNEEQSKQRIKSAYSPSETNLYDAIADLFKVIDEGDNKVNVPLYNGGLFITKPAADDESDEAKVARFLAKYKIPDRHLALGLDRLARDEDDKRHELVPMDYKSLGVRHLGSIYEGLLEFKVRVAAERMAVVKGKKGELVVPAREAESDGLKILTRVQMHGAEDGYLKKGSVYLENDKHERKATGSYYTPDYIVKYIVEHTVGPVLEEKLNGLRDDFRKAEAAYHAAKKKDAALKKQGLSDDPEKVANEYKSLVDRLFTLRVLDPAMGSGHFLVEAVDFITDRVLAFLNGFAWNPVQHFIQRTRRDILNALQKAEVTVDPAKLTDINLLKRHVLKRCIFGVDLNPMAVELAKVSLWLDCFTLGAPLSFLDHHLKCGNSLIGVTVDAVAKTVKESAPMWGNTLLEQLRQARDHLIRVGMLGDSTAQQAAESRNEFSKANSKLGLVRRAFDIYTSQWFGNGFVGAKGKAKRKKESVIAAIEYLSHALPELMKGRTYHDPDADDWFNAVPEVARYAASEIRFFHWELEFPEVFYAAATSSGQVIQRVEGAGFDAVIGNPPYVRQELIKPLKPFLSEQFTCHSSAADLFVYFYEQSVRLAGQGRSAAYVASSTWTKTASGEPLRKFLNTNTNVVSFVDFGDLPVFDGATTYPCIMVLRKDPPGANHEVRSFVVLDFEEPVIDRLLPSPVTVPQADLEPGGWRFENRALAKLREKITTAGVPLKEYCGSPLYGIKTGLNEAFVVDQATRDALVKTDKRSAEVLKPFLEGKDLKPWRAEPRDLWLIFTRRGIDIKKYPAILEHLEGYRELLEVRPADWNEKEQGKWKGRKPGSYKWYEIQDNVAYYADFEKPKIIYPHFNRVPNFAIDAEGTYYSNDKSYIIPHADFSLLSVLNSSTLWFWFKGVCALKAGDFYEFRIIYIENAPVATAPSAVHVRLTEIAKRLSKEGVGEAEQAKLQAELEARVACLYGLTTEEFTLVLNAMPHLPQATRTAAQALFTDLQ